MAAFGDNILGARPTEPYNNRVPSGGQERSAQLGNTPFDRQGVIEEEVTYADNGASIALEQTLPPGCRVEWVAIKYTTALGVDGGDASGTANAVALVAGATLSGDVTATTNQLISGSTTVTQNTATRGRSIHTNTGEAVQALTIYPTDASSTNKFNVQGDTTGYKFNGTGKVSVKISYKQFDDPYDG